MITDSDIEKLKTVFATKEDLKDFATKADLKEFATKKDLDKCVTNVTFNVAIDRLLEYINDTSESILAAINKADFAGRLNDHEQRIKHLEKGKTN